MAFAEKKRLLELSPDKIVPNPAQPRLDFPQDELLQLAESIRQNGVLPADSCAAEIATATFWWQGSAAGVLRVWRGSKPSRPLCRSFLRRTARCWRLLKTCSAVI